MKNLQTGACSISISNVMLVYWSVGGSLSQKSPLTMVWSILKESLPNPEAASGNLF